MLVTVWLDTARARPKSATLTVPLSLMMTFSGLTSRWIRPFAWASASASSTGSRMSRAARGESGPSACITSRRVWPGTYSIARKMCPSSSPWSNTATTLGCDNEAAERASRRNRVTKLSSCTRCWRMTLRAMSRSSRSSTAR